MSKSPEHRTLFALNLTDERARKRVRAPSRAKASGAGATTDVNRHRPMVVAAVVGMLGVFVGWRAAPPTASPRGALALPHSRAGLTCAKCHEQDKPTGAASENVCVSCHGAHASTRAGHRALMDEGKLACVDCHDVHGDDEGVRFLSPDGDAVRYGVGAEAPVPTIKLPSHRDVTVPLIPIRRCSARCHDPGQATDPIGRCVSQDGRLNVCFGEHQQWSAVVPPRAGGVCASQHENDRFAAWDAAREVAGARPAPPVLERPARGRWWLLTGALGGALGFAGYWGASLMRSRRARREGKQSVAMTAADRVRLPQIDTNTCLGCYACVDACPYDVFTVERYVAKVERRDACCGLTLCEQVCPNGSLVITDGDAIGNRPRIDDMLQALDAPGVYLAGDVTGLPLIKNAIRQGATAVENIARSLTKHSAPLDLVIIGAGPAGISAALKSKELGLRYRIIDQGSVAQSIRSFPRGKLVFDQPLELPVTGKLWLVDATKEELLAKWERLIRTENIEVREGMRFISLERDGDELLVRSRDVETDSEHTYRTARMLLAIGVRGSPRRLPFVLSDELQSKVFYHLVDARGFATQRALVVGLGDVAMECAVALAHQPDCTVTVVHRGPGFSRGKKRNIDELKRLAKAGRVRLLFGAQVQRVARTSVAVATGDVVTEVPNDVVFVMIGSEAPSALLEKAGVQVGTAL